MTAGDEGGRALQKASVARICGKRYNNRSAR